MSIQPDAVSQSSPGLCSEAAAIENNYLSDKSFSRTSRNRSASFRLNLKTVTDWSGLVARFVYWLGSAFMSNNSDPPRGIFAVLDKGPAVLS